MKKLLAGLILTATLALTSVFPAQARETMSTAEAARLLTPSVFSFGVTGSNNAFCTATKIGPREYLTALHCAIYMDTNYKLESVTGEYAFIRSILGSTTKKYGGGKKREDWAILIASTANAAPALSLGCGDTHYVGEPVAYMGFPQGLERAFGAGYVSTLESGQYNNADVFVDLPAAPGASGSAVISMETGTIMGVLTEGVLNSRTREFYMIGLESIENVDQCKDWAERMKHWGEMGEDDSFIPGNDRPSRTAQLPEEHT